MTEQPYTNTDVTHPLKSCLFSKLAASRISAMLLLLLLRLLHRHHQLLMLLLVS